MASESSRPGNKPTASLFGTIRSPMFNAKQAAPHSIVVVTCSQLPPPMSMP